mgnify:FL=1
MTSLVDYDKLITEYNQIRAGSKSDNDWCSHIVDYYKEAMSYRILEYLQMQGCNPER